MPQVRNKGNVGDKWSRNAQNATPNYESGVRSPRRSWANSAKAAEKNYQTAVVEAAGKGNYGKGIDKAGDSAWAQGTQQKGVQRYGAGVAVSQNRYESAVAPFLQVIESTSLPPRGPKGSPANFQRVSVMAEALRKAAQK